MSDLQFSRGGDDLDPGKPRNKRRFGGKSPKKKQKSGVVDRVRARRKTQDEDDDFLETLDDDLDVDVEEEDLDEFEGYEDGWEFEEDEDL